MLVAAQSFAGMTFAAEPQVPVLWDAKERLPKPDLSALPRLRFL
ncbi:MAG: amino acid ABC transporter, partial [Mesorhizobium sp.]